MTFNSNKEEKEVNTKHSKAVRKGKRTAAINLDDAIERALAKDNN